VLEMVLTRSLAKLAREHPRLTAMSPSGTWLPCRLRPWQQADN
jgi:hypothetical protein